MTIRHEQSLREGPLRFETGETRAAVMPVLVSPDWQGSDHAALDLTLKRAFDIVGAIIAIVVLSPLFASIVLSVMLDSPGPAIFRQRRNGLFGKRFVIYKFRSMSVQEDGSRVIQATRGDARITRIGRFLRKSSLDELPQLFNVLLGDMSLVGPRPHALAHDEEYGALLRDYRRRARMKPGITGLAQITGRRGETADLRKMRERVVFDLWYIENWSIGLDMWILLRTPWSLLTGKAY